MDTEVLVCGAGPTGLMLALRLARAGIRLRIVDAAAEAGTTSRALVVHARTLEFYRQMGLAEEFSAQGLRFDEFNLWVRGRRVGHSSLGAAGQGISAFPYMHVVTQDRHEAFLVDQLARRGIAVERNTTLVDFEQGSDGVRARVRDPRGGESTCTALYLAGCDGARSRVREVQGVGFPGATYSHIFYVADLDATGPVMNGQLHIALDESNLLGVFPLLGGRTARLIGTVRPIDDDDTSVPTWEDVSKQIVERLGIVVLKVNWFSTYRVHHRVAERFAQGRAFLLGDAAHIHSPAGGQGLNTGIGDAVNLAWKLAEVVRGRAAAKLLDTYEPERIAFARKLVATTDQGFVFATSPGKLARFVRTKVVPLVAPGLFRMPAVRRFQFRVLSQTSIAYRGSALSSGAVGAVHGGDRLPYVQLAEGDNHAVLDGSAWQVHVYGEPCAALEPACRRLGVALHVFPWEPALRKSPFLRGALYLVRPDGHVALADRGLDAGALERYVSERRG